LLRQGGAVTRPVFIFMLSLAVIGVGSGVWAQQRGQAPGAGPYANCNLQAAGSCTDAGVVACQNTHKGNLDAIRQCQMNVNMSCNTQHDCPNSAQ
jgi:hypothetical protein